MGGTLRDFRSPRRGLPGAIALALAGAALAGSPARTAVAQDRPAPNVAGTRTYVADLEAVNPALTGRVDGQARVVIDGGQVRFEVDARGVPPGMMHLQHTHGLADGPARCPDADADANGDGVVDLLEAESYTGTTMIPFHETPTSMEILAETYPTADDDGVVHYRETVALDALERAFEESFPDQDFDWPGRVVMMHGVPADADVPDSARSLPDVPAHVTLPIACGTLEPRWTGGRRS